MRIAIAIATTGRAELIRRMAPQWLAQTRPADRVVVAGAAPADAAGVAEAFPAIEVIVARKGLPAQRNAALDRLGGDCELVIFLDDDFYPSRNFVAEAEALFTREPSVTVGTGLVLRDGINTEGVSFEDAVALVEAHDAQPQEAPRIQPTKHAYGCNMMVRVSADPALRFDERLPLYAWQEDRDFSRRLGAHGRIVHTSACAGVHMGIKSGRQSGVRMGYSQIANPVYLVGKNSMTPAEAAALMGKNMLKNIVRTPFPEKWTDRRGRLAGNLLAIRDAFSGALKPERILDL